MAKYQIKFSCGHTEIRDLIGKVVDRERKIEYFENHGTCSECYKAEQEAKKAEEYAKAKAGAEEYGLPALTGTEKQIAWAEKLRIEFVSKVDADIKQGKSCIEKLTADKHQLLEKVIEKMQEIEDVFAYTLQSETSAKFWIENREKSQKEILKEGIGKMKKATAEATPEAQEVLSEAIVKPQGQTEKGIVEIKSNNKAITLDYEKNEKFIKLVKSVGYTWQGVWVKKLNNFTGCEVDRVAEIGNLLLSNGFAISILDATAREKAISGEFKQECDKWIKLVVADCEYKGWIILEFHYGDRVFDVAKKLPSAKYYPKMKGIVVKPLYFEEVEDFAGLYGFDISVNAQKELKKERERAENAKTVKPKKVGTKTKKDGLQEVLNSDAEVIDDLQD